ncbi:MAG: AraC family transcriptional regulator [Dehalococcoidales bacterium]|nr:MAG: AraC family transcriptional regulator [Dehalococcoidales bacterium]
MAESRASDSRKKYLREEYVSRINRVLDYIETHIDEDLTLEDLARVASFSPFYFHRIFGAMVGETLNAFIQRIRVEKAASQLINNPKKSVTEIALDCGFSGPTTFARAFREYFSMSASQWRTGGYLQEGKIRQMDGKIRQPPDKNGKDSGIPSYYTEVDIQNQKWRVTMQGESNLKAEVEVRDIPEFHMAYVRHVGPYAGDVELFGRLWEKIIKWAGPRGLFNFPETKMLSAYHDDPNITDPNKLRVSVGISVPENTPVEGEVGKMTIPGGKYAMARFEISPDKYPDAWEAVFGGWFPESGYQPADGPSYELYLNNPEEHPEKKHIFDIVIPVKPL